MPFIPNDLTLNPPASFTAPIASGPGFLSGLLGAGASALNPFGAVVGGAADVAKAALTTTPDELTGSITTSLSQQFASAFNVGRGKLESSPSLTGAPVSSGATAPSMAASGDLSGNAIIWIVAAVLGVLVLAFGFLGRK